MNYIEQALRTNSPDTGTFDVSPDLIHATLGLNDECFELAAAINSENVQNLIEETGDLCWFIALAGHALDFDPFTDIPNYELELLTPAPQCVFRFNSLVKKSYAYGKPLPTLELRTILTELVCGLRAVIQVVHTELEGPTFEQVLEGNIAKLKARYPEKFSLAHATHRDTAAEMAAMEARLQ